MSEKGVKDGTVSVSERNGGNVWMRTEVVMMFKQVTTMTITLCILFYIQVHIIQAVS